MDHGGSVFDRVSVFTNISLSAPVAFDFSRIYELPLPPPSPGLPPSLPRTGATDHDSAAAGGDVDAMAFNAGADVNSDKPLLGLPPTRAYSAYAGDGDGSSSGAPLPRQNKAAKFYPAPENVLEIAVTNPVTRGTGRNKFTDFEVICETNLPGLKPGRTVVHRRYSDFEWLQEMLSRELPRIEIPQLPGKVYKNRFDSAVIEARRTGLQQFIYSVASSGSVLKNSRVIVPFLQDRNFYRGDYVI